MFESPVGYPVLVHDQIGESLKVFCGLALRVESGYRLGERYTGEISVVRVGGQFGQDEQLHILHGIHHFSKRNSACFWIYPDEIEIMYHDFDKSWDRQEKQAEIMELARRLTKYAPDFGESSASDRESTPAQSG